MNNKVDDNICITKKLMDEHPIFSNSEFLLNKIFEAWSIIWDTKIGNPKINFLLTDIEPRAQIIGEFFETIFSKIIGEECNTVRGSSKEKDIIFRNLDLSKYNFEIKTSGQLGGGIYGNRSYNQPDSNGDIDSISRKGKSGYYLCINFYRFNIYKIRIGWINSNDWKPQKSQNGQAAILEDYVYAEQLIELYDYRLLFAEPITLPGVGPLSPIIADFRNIYEICEYIKDILPINDLAEFIINKTNSESIKELNKINKKIITPIKSIEFLNLYHIYLISIGRLK